MGTATVKSNGHYSHTGQVMYTPQRGLVTLRFQTKLHPQRSASQLLFSFYYDALQGRGLNPELWIAGAKQGDSGPYWYKAATEGSWVQKQSPQLEIRAHEQDSRNNSCEVVNSVSRVMSESRKLSLDSSWVLSTPTSCTWLIPWLPPSFGVMVITAALLGYFRPWRKVGL
ncbi:Fc receptor-like protein 6 [Dugong dugon]